MANLRIVDAHIESVTKKFVFAKNLPPDMAEKELVKLIRRFEPMTKVKILRNNATEDGMCAYVKFEKTQNANLAVKCFNGFMVRGRRIQLFCLSQVDTNNDKKDMVKKLTDFTEQQLNTYSDDFSEIAKDYMIGFALPDGVDMLDLVSKFTKHIVDKHMANLHPEFAQFHVNNFHLFVDKETKPAVPGAAKDSAMDSERR